MPVFMDFIIYPRNKDKQFFIVSEAMNYQMFKDFKADYVVMKDRVHRVPKERAGPRAGGPG